MLLSRGEIVDLIGEGVVENIQDMDQINGSSLDLRLGPNILVECMPKHVCPSCGHIMDGMEVSCIHSSIALGRGHTCSACMTYCLGVHYIVPVDLEAKETLTMKGESCSGKRGYLLAPGHSVLAGTIEVFNLPNDITMIYSLKSSMARCFMEHLNAGFCDPGWNGSTLTLEFVNLSRHHNLILREGMKCGQARFHRHTAVPHEHSYAVKGNYNNDIGATASKGLR